ncbi:J domain-containing protein [Sphingomonas immobilis]|uniref:J domain-containing protein n=1 Tax=Sphingomonas immobilis TaxID=3063997 RepID=A0ABT8ZTM3_9SPHN|nr:J domain-containing protein [Sphingomonas sp. CA1-15]MDO7840911.1 J domain-containing protein [Sphingomonas sp. CA1-15]
MNPYAVLGLAQDADGVVIRAAWKALIAKHHPDLTDDPASYQRATEINQAYAILGDPARRAAFDRGRSSRSGPAGIALIELRTDAAPAALSGTAAAPPRRSLRRRVADIAFTAALLLTAGATVFAIQWFDDSQQSIASQRPAPPLRPARASADLVDAAPAATPTAIASELERIAAMTKPAVPSRSSEQILLGEQHFEQLVRRSGRAAAVAYSLRCNKLASANASADIFDFCTGFDQALRRVASGPAS